MAQDVFISYSSKDTAIADAACAALEKNGVSCWIAPRNILPGEEWSEAIIDALNECRVLVLIFSSNANASPQVLREVERAVSKRIPILPFRVEAVALSKTMEYFISVPHWLDALAPPLEPHLATLTETVRRLLARGALPDAAASSPAPSRPSESLADVPPEELAHHLPAVVTAFVGREEEVRSVHALLDGGARLVTLTGSGGSGKTRIALRVAEERTPRYPGGTWWVDISALQLPEQVAPSLAVALDIPEDPDVPVIQQLKARLRDPPALLVLDNFEQVVQAAPDLGELIRACPSLTLLVTSRAILNLSFEHEYPVPGMAMEEAVQLFATRAQQARASFSLDDAARPTVASLCRRLDGIPLALELAAAQVRMMNVVQIEKQLVQRFRVLVSPYGDVSQRQRTLRAAVDWSYDLLTDDERSLFDALSVFVSGFNLEAAEAVSGRDDVFLGVARLREQSLLQADMTADVPRFQMLETLQEYGREKLRASGEEDPAERHARFFAALAQREDRNLVGSGSEVALATLTADVDNLRSAWEWMLTHGDADQVALMSIALAEFWERQGWLREGRDHLTRCLVREEEIVDPRCRARLLEKAGWLAFLQADYGAAGEWQERALALLHKAGDRKGEVDLLNDLALVAQARGDEPASRELFERSLALAREVGNLGQQAEGLSNLGLLAIREGQLEHAREHLEEARSLFQRNRDAHGAAISLCNLSDLALKREDWTEADTLSRKSLQLFRQLNDTQGIAYALANLAEAATHQGEHDDALRQVGEALSLCMRTGAHGLVPVLLEIRGRNQAALGVEHEGLFDLAGAQSLRDAMQTPRSRHEQEAIAAVEDGMVATLGESLARTIRARATDLPLEEIVGELLASAGAAKG
jgi:predicted ATPase